MGNRRLPYTPKHLADKILPSKSALEGERKQVTVLFADVKGSMELAEQLDPEIWHGILERFFEILTEGVHRFEGTVNQYTGDGIMALFGAPIAHEDHAQRACYAALHLQHALRAYSDELRVDPGVSFAYRMGINSGEVVVGKIGDDLRMDYTAQGHTVGLAQRMEQLAPADGIALSEHSQRLVGEFFALRALGPSRIKGASEPVEIFVLEDVGRHRTRLDLARARGLSRFVGRAEEMETLEAALQHSLGGTGRVAAAVGEAGVGKSRLCLEFVERCRARGLAVYEAHCPAHGRSIPYLPLLELLRNLFGIRDEDRPREARQKIAGELALLDNAFADDRALVLDFLGVADPSAPPLELEAAVRQRKLFEFLRRLIQRRTEAEPIVLLVDDLHWIDPGSDLFLSQIVEAVGATRTLLLVNFRPEYEAHWTRKSWVLQLPMAPLGPEALAELVRDWVGSAPSVARLPALVGEQSGGNPFFTEEIVLSLIENGHLEGTRGAYELATPLDSLEVPPTVQALLAGRIDRLTDREKQVLTTAAVIGKEFPRPLLEAVTELAGPELDEALAGLLASELVFERALYPVAEYAFKHPLTHEVALATQLDASRRARHAAVAKAIEEAHAGQLDEQAGLLAHHWSEAGDALRAAAWHARAARWVAASDLQASRRHWSRVRELLVELEDSPERARLLLDAYPELLNTINRLGALPAESSAVFEEARALARAAADRRAEGRIEAAYGWLKTGQNEWVEATDHSRLAMALADSEGDVPTQLFARFIQARALLWRAPLREVVRVTDDVVPIGAGDAAAEIEMLGWRPYIEALSIRSLALSHSGRVAEGMGLHERLHTLMGRPGVLADTTSPRADIVWTCWLLGDGERARRFAAESLQTAERYGSWSRVYALLANVLAREITGQWQEGLDFVARAREVIAATGTAREWEMMLHSREAMCRAGLGDDRALELALRGVEETRAADVLLPRTFVEYIRARVLRLLGGRECADELEAQIETTIALIDRGDLQAYLPFALLERAGLAKLRGESDAAARDLAEARRGLYEMGATGWEAYARSIEDTK